MSNTAITMETRRKSYREKKLTIGACHNKVLKYLEQYNYTTANELAKVMYLRGEYPDPSRNHVHPRLNELVAAGKVEVTDVRKCPVTGRTCAVYRVKGE